MLSLYGPVFISSESPLSKSLAKYALNISPDRIHHAIAFSSLIVSESATMAVESAILGTPVLYSTTLVGLLPIIDELEKKYGLAYQFLPTDSDHLLIRAKNLMEMPDRKEQWQLRQKRMLADKIDLTDWIVDLPVRLQPLRTSA
jgi:hypothetical protein